MADDIAHVVKTYLEQATFSFEEAVNHPGPEDDKLQLAQDLGLLLITIMESDDRDMRITLEHGLDGQVIVKAEGF